MARKVTVNWTFSFTYDESELTELPHAPDEQLVVIAKQISQSTIAHGAGRLKAVVTHEVKK